MNKLTATQRLFIGAISHKFHRWISNMFFFFFFFVCVCVCKKAEYIIIHSVTDGFGGYLRVLFQNWRLVMDSSIRASLPVFAPLWNWRILITAPLITVSVPMPCVRADLPVPRDKGRTMFCTSMCLVTAKWDNGNGNYIKGRFVMLSIF